MDDIIILFSEKKILKTFNFQRKNFPYLSLNKSNYSKVPKLSMKIVFS